VNANRDASQTTTQSASDGKPAETSQTTTGSKGGDDMPRTGQQAAASGIYANDCHRKEIALSKGETFPPCSGCKRAASWRLVRATK
jgi:hypothetical protein